MPRKPKFTKAEVLASAYEVTRISGFESVTASAVAANMKYTGSSLFTHYGSMEELKADVYRKARENATDYLAECLNYVPAFKEFGLRWVRFAKKEPNLYRLLFANNPYGRKGILDEFEMIFMPILKEVQLNFSLSEEEAKELIIQCVTQANGISCFIINGSDEDFSEEQISRYLSNACLGMVMLLKVRDGRMTNGLAEKLSLSVDELPRHK